MRSSKFGFRATNGLLLASGLLAAGLAATMFIAPDAIYAVYGIEIGSNVNLANELKAPVGVLLITGLLALSGVLRAELVTPALGTAAGVYLSYGLSRLASVVIDGVPDIALVVAAVIEMAVGGACLLRLVHIRRENGE